MAGSCRIGGGGCDENPVGLAALINAANRFLAIDFPRPLLRALHSFSTGHRLRAPLWQVVVENGGLLLFLLDDGGGLRGSA